MRARCLTALLAFAALLAAPASLAADPPAAPAAGGIDSAAQPPPAADVQAQGQAVVDQLMKDKEDLITGKRFSYDPGGRRDPFRSLLETVSRFKGPRPKGVAGMLVGEVDLVGVVEDSRGSLAFFKGSDNKGYFLRVGDEVYDGRIIAINVMEGTVTFRQRIEDPRQIKPFRDIVKRLTPQTEEEAQ